MMDNNIIYIFTVFYLVFFIVLIIKEQKYIKKKKDMMVIYMDGGIDITLVNTIVWLVFFIIWSWLLFDAIYRIYSPFKGIYINNPIQLFNLEYLDNLREYFYENMMLSELSTIVHYQSSIISRLNWTIASGCISAVNLSRHLRRYAIYEDEIMTPGGRIKLDSILSYRWGDCAAGRDNELHVTFKHGKFAAKLLNENTYDKKFRIKCRDKEKVEDFLKEVVKN